MNDMKTIYIVPIEPIETRYTCHWHDHIPQLIEDVTDKYRVVTVDGVDVPPTPTPGAFLDFGATNIYKSSQLIKIAEMFRTGVIRNGDKFLFTDAWNTSILQVKYMAELLNIDVEIHGLWHAGSYDPQDFLGRLIKDKRWTNSTEKAIFYSLDKNWFATEDHMDMFKMNVFGDTLNFPSEELSPRDRSARFGRTGWPMEYMTEMIGRYEGPKEDIILFPHRLAPEKQVDIFKDLEKQLPEFQWIVCQEEKLTKQEYHKLLGRSKMVFSANLQETLGISVPEGMAAGCIPLVPDRLSYSEMYGRDWMYPSEWTADFEMYELHKEKLVNKIRAMMLSYDEMARSLIEKEYTRIHGKYFCADNLVEDLISE
jgi:glycosyltransferase involved in cell wall biosynthesis